MTILTKASAKDLFRQGDKPTETDFSDLFDSLPFVPAGGTGFIEVESTASATMRAVGAVGVQLVQASATAQVQRLISTSVAFEFLNAQTTASAQSVIGLANLAVTGTATGNAPAFDDRKSLPGMVEVITGHIDTPANRSYILDQHAAYAYDIDSFIAKTSGGRATASIRIENTTVGGIHNAPVSATEVAVTASANKSVAVGNTVRLMLGATSSPADLSFTIRTFRQ